jgi:alkane 1-monooxygenase
VTKARFCAPFLFLATAPAGLLLGGAWTFLTLALVPLALCGLDWALGGEPEDGRSSAGPIVQMIPRLYVLAQIAVSVWMAARLTRPGIGITETVGATLSAGLAAGVFGMSAAHDLVHRRAGAERALGLSFLALVGYMHFRIAHIHGHHVRAATPADPATARRGESAYAFIGRTVVGQAREAWGFEAARLRRRGRPPIGPGNRILRYVAIEGLVAAGFAALGPRAFGFWLCQAMISVVMLELFNYIAHYGMARRVRPDGTLERLSARHSWNASRRMNNAALFNMGRHSDHHRRPSQAYAALEAMEGAPELPTGYAGAILLALAPSLWRRVMDPRLDALAA